MKKLLLLLSAVALLFVFAGDSSSSAFGQTVRKKVGERRSKIRTNKNNTRTAPKLRSRSNSDDPWQGEVGVSRTTAEIQAESDALAPATEVRERRPRKRIPPDRKDLPQNPESPEIPMFPYDPSVAPVRDNDAQLVPSTPQTIGTTFDGATLFDTLSFPPDTMGDVGPTQYVVAVNGWIRSFSKTTGTADGVLNANIDTFFSSVRNGTTTTDPRIKYDRLSQRWIVVIINTPASNNRVLVATSNTSTITAGTVWTFYFFQINTVTPAGDNNCFADYPTLGVDANALYIGVNNFCPTNFAGTSGYVVRKSSVLSGGPIVVTAFRGLVPTSSSDGAYTPQGVDNPDPTATVGYFIGVSNAVFGRLILRRVSDPGGTPTISSDILLSVPSTAYASTVPHLGNTGGTNGNLDSLDDRLYQAYLRNGRIYAAHNIGLNSSGTSSSTPDRTGSRWYEIENLATTPTLRQSGTWFDNAASNPKNYWIPSIMVTGQGHIALGGSSAGANDRVNAATIGRLSGDTLGTLQSTAIYTSSSTAYNPAGDSGGTSGRRWGDYSYTSVDPEDDMTMWTIQQYCHASNSYAVRIAKLIAPPPASIASASPSTINSGQASVNVTITGTSSAGSGFFDPGAGFAKRLAASVSGSGVTVNSVTYTSPTQITLNLSTVGATAGARNVTVTNPDGQATTANNLITIQSNPTTTQRAPFDFDGDNKTDISIYRPSLGQWWVQRSATSTTVADTFGNASDIITPVDFTGDLKADIAVFRPSTGAWFVLRSENSTFYSFPFGTNGDVPTPGDFDGDAKADAAVFRPSNSTWYILGSLGNTVIQSFGANGDVPVSSDYDGDGKADIAIYRPSLAQWWLLRSQAGLIVYTFGAPGDKTVQGDYTGDGKSDVAVWRPSTGAWFILRSEDASFYSFPFGTNGDTPVPGDYDGDGKIDAGVFRSSASTWFLNRSTAGVLITGFGINTDIPTPSAFVR